MYIAYMGTILKSVKVPKDADKHLFRFSEYLDHLASLDV